MLSLEWCYEGSAKTEFIDHLSVRSFGFVAHSTVMESCKVKAADKAFGGIVRPCTYSRMYVQGEYVLNLLFLDASARHHTERLMNAAIFPNL